MTEPSLKRHGQLTLIEVILVVIALGVAGFFLVRNLGIAREREQRRQITEAMEQWWGANRQSEQETKAAERVFALVKANPKLHDAKSNWGITPLHIAAVHGNRDIAQWLLDHGADVNAKDNFGWTPLQWAANYGHKEVAELLLAKGADVNAKDNSGATPLGWAKVSSQQEIIELLLKHGAKE